MAYTELSSHTGLHRGSPVYDPVSEYYLMSQDSILARFTADIRGGMIDVINILNSSQLPLGAKDAGSIIDWYKGRRIPDSRKCLEDLKIKTRLSLDGMLARSYALSLSDSFWVKPVGLRSMWRGVNFFTNNFTDDIGDFLLAGDGDIHTLISPSTTTDGMFPKKWTIVDSSRVLVKCGNWYRTRYDDLNEIVASAVLRILTRNNQVAYVDYFRMGSDCCGCNNFVKEGQNLVTAHRYLLSIDVDLDTTPKDLVHAYLKEVFGQTWLDTMLLLDYIIFNCDRHYNNFGFIQDAITGKLLRPAPIYDNGDSLFAALPFVRVSDICNQDFRARPFAPTHDAQLRFVNLEPFKSELRELKYAIQPLFREVYQYTLVGKWHLDKEHLTAMAKVLQARVDYLNN